VQQLQRLFDGKARLRAQFAGFPAARSDSPAINLLKDRRLIPIDRPDRRRVNPRLAAVRGKGAQHRRQLAGKLGKTQIGIPQTQIKRVGHLC
jgi:hypothetical protein